MSGIHESMETASVQAQQAIARALQARAQQYLVRELIALRSIGWIDGETADQVSVLALGRPMGEAIEALGGPAPALLPLPHTSSPQGPGGGEERPNAGSAGVEKPARRGPRLKGETPGTKTPANSGYSQGKVCPICGTPITNKSRSCRQHKRLVNADGSIIGTKTET